MANPSPTRGGRRRDNPLLARAAEAVRGGRPDEARDLLDHLVRQRPDSAKAWLYLSSVTSDPRQAQSLLRQALRLDPRDQQAIRALRALGARTAARAASPPLGRRSPLRRWLGIWLLVAALILVLGGFAARVWANWSNAEQAALAVPALTSTPTATPTPTWTPTPGVPERVGRHLPELTDAWEARDWQRALAVLDDVTLLDSTYPGLQDAKCDTVLHWIGDLVRDEQIKPAYHLARRARAYCADGAEAEREQRLALAYLAGSWRYERQRWEAAADAFRTVYDAEPGYAQTQSLLYTSYISATHQLMAENHLLDAQQTIRSALEIDPNGEQAQALFRQIRARLAPKATPVPARTGNKRIEINLSQQRMYVWEGDRLVYKWVCSTGEPGRATAPGHFRILDKIPEAWASTWSLRMPYWMGIYWAGTLENGIHALPINPDGSRLWEGYLGRRVSYGCVILSTENARTLFNWAPVGTPVWIHH